MGCDAAARYRTSCASGEQGVVVALGGTAGVVSAVWGGEFGEHGIQGGAGLRGQIARDGRHLVGTLRAQGDAATPGPVGVGEVAVGVEAVAEFELGQFVGAVLAAEAGQLGFGVGPGVDVDEVG